MTSFDRQVVFAREVNLIALDLLPRMLSRAQAFDVLTSMANIAGYRAVVRASQGSRELQVVRRVRYVGVFLSSSQCL